MEPGLFSSPPAQFNQLVSEEVVVLRDRPFNSAGLKVSLELLLIACCFSIWGKPNKQHLEIN